MDAMGIACLVLVGFACLMALLIMAYGFGYEKAREEAAKNNGGYWIVDKMTGITKWNWGPDPNFKKPKPEPAPGTVIRKP